MGIQDEITESLEDFTMWDNTGVDLTVSVIVFLITFLFIYFFKFVVLRKMSQWRKKALDTERAKIIFKSINKTISFPLVLVLAIYTASFPLNLPEIVESGLHVLVITIAAWFGIKFALTIVDSLITYQQVLHLSLLLEASAS